MVITLHVKPFPLNRFINRIKHVEGSFNNEGYIRKTSRGEFTIRGELLKFEEIEESNIEAIVEEVKEIFTLLFTLSSNYPNRNEAAIFRKAMQLGKICPSLILLKEMSVSYKTINKQTKRIRKLETRLATNIIRYQRRINRDSLKTILACGRYLQNLRIKTAEEIREFKKLSQRMAKDESVKQLEKRKCPHRNNIKFLNACVEKWKRTVEIIKDLLDPRNQ